MLMITQVAYRMKWHDILFKTRRETKTKTKFFIDCCIPNPKDDIIIVSWKINLEKWRVHNKIIVLIGTINTPINILIEVKGVTEKERRQSRGGLFIGHLVQSIPY